MKRTFHSQKEGNKFQDGYFGITALKFQCLFKEGHFDDLNVIVGVQRHKIYSTA